MREILFRGKRVDNGEWVEGYYVKINEYRPRVAKHIIIPLNATLFPGTDGLSDYKNVIPETVGQWTGLTDMTGKKIFDGDIVDCTFYYDIGQYPKYSTKRRLVQYKIGGFYPFTQCTNDPAYIVGNIHDNPELLEETKK